MNNRPEDYGNMIDRLWGHLEDGQSKNITFQVTDACQLKCTYCYQHCKSNHYMSFDVAKKYIDTFFEHDDGSIIAVVLDFIGGEPLLAVDLMNQIVEYWDLQCLTLNPRWLERTMISISSNGVAYFQPKVQEFIKKNQWRLSLSISIDGNQELHDSARLFPDGRGSYDIAHAAAEHYKNTYGGGSIGSKITIAPENLSYLVKAIKHYIENDGSTLINANTVFEEGWTIEHARIFYQELKEIADYIIDNNYDFIYLSLFDDNFFKPMDPEDNQNWCGGTGRMVACDYKGDIFPCLRYMKSSIGDKQPEYIIGTIETGIDKSEVEKLETITRRSQSTDECFYCPVAAGCAWCSGLNYEVFGTPNKRATFICWMHKARSLANVYYWNKLYNKNNTNKVFEMYLPKEDALQIIDEVEYELLVEMVNIQKQTVL